MIPRLIALQLLTAGIAAQAQSYYIKINGDKYTRIADHAAWEQNNATLAETLDAYNLDLPSGNTAIGTMRFRGATGSMSYATHYRLNSTSEQLVARKLQVSGVVGTSFFLLAEKVVSGTVRSAAILYYNRINGNLDKAWELKALPSGFTLLRAFDVIMDANHAELHVLCTVKKDGKQSVMELLFNPVTAQYKVLQYNPASLLPEQYKSVYYLRLDHYGFINPGTKTSFYGTGIAQGKSIAFCNWGNKYEQYNLLSLTGTDEVAGVQMNGSYANNGSQYQLSMAFMDADGDMCIQQKTDPTTRNWRRAYHLTGGKWRMSMGHDGHGIKGYTGMDYFIVSALHLNFSDHEGQISTLHYNLLNGDINKANIWHFSGIGITQGDGAPNTTDDPGSIYTFAADRFNQQHGFKFGTGNASTIGEMSCTDLYELKVADNTLRERTDDINITTYGSYNAATLDMVKVSDVRVEAIPECETEQRGTAPDNTGFLLQSASTVQMNTEHLRITTDKAIATVQLLSIDGRCLLTAGNINSSNFQQHFAHILVPGIYVVRIGYADQSSEVRKISIH